MLDYRSCIVAFIITIVLPVVLSICMSKYFNLTINAVWLSLSITLLDLACNEYVRSHNILYATFNLIISALVYGVTPLLLWGGGLLVGATMVGYFECYIANMLAILIVSNINVYTLKNLTGEF